MTEDLRDRLERLGLSQYFDPFVAEGFDSWAIVVDITESDLTALNVKLGHRRKLQRAIVESTGRPIAPFLTDHRKGSADEPYRSDDSTTESRSAGKRTGDPSAQSGTTTKRKYRRHPKPDDNAPERPPSAYVIFSNQVRETLKGQNYSFTEIAKIVGERWQVLSSGERESCERQASLAKERYNSELASYKKTAEYAMHQEYLAEFKAKHGPAKSDRKKTKSEAEANPSAAKGGGIDSVRPSLMQPNTGGSGESIAHRPARPEISPQCGPYFAPKATSTSSYPFSGMSSPTNRDQYSPLSASPMCTLNREPSYEQTYQQSGMAVSEHGAHDRTRIESQSALPPSHTMQGHYCPQVDRTASDLYAHTGSVSFSPPTATTHQPFGTSHQVSPGTSIPDLASRRSQPGRDSQQLPSLTHDDTTLSSDSGAFTPPNFTPPNFTQTNFPYQRPPMFPHDRSQGSKERILPHPVPSGVRQTPPIAGSSRVPTAEFGRSTPRASPGLSGPGWPALLAVAAREGDDGKREGGMGAAPDPENRTDRTTDKPP